MEHYIVTYESHLDGEFLMEVLCVVHNLPDAQELMRNNKDLVDRVAENWDFNEVADGETVYWRGITDSDEYAMLSIRCPSEEVKIDVGN